MKAEVLPQHQWLMKLAGEWSHESDCPPEADGTVRKMRGRESVRSIGGIWLVAEGQGSGRKVWPAAARKDAGSRSCAGTSRGKSLDIMADGGVRKTPGRVR